MQNWPITSSFAHLAIQNGLQDHNSDFRILNGSDMSKLCSIVGFSGDAIKFIRDQTVLSDLT